MDRRFTHEKWLDGGVREEFCSAGFTLASLSGF